nr:MAG TPA: hypothetical protein [Caudoviricetes sp.]
MSPKVQDANGLCVNGKLSKHQSLFFNSPL